MNYSFGRNILLSTVGFDRLLDAFSDLENTLPENKSTSYPPYNIIKRGDHDYVIEIAVAGFRRDELDITFEGRKLTVTGKVNVERGGEYLHRGVAMREFTHSFTLAETVVVNSADLEDGMLVVRLQNVIPEEKKPRKILIGGDAKYLVEESAERVAA